MNKIIKIGVVLLLTFLLVLIRFFESNLFYDPLYYYFKSNYTNLPIPEVETIKFIGNITVRFLMNAIVSVTILWVLFKSWSIIKLSSILYGLFFVFLMMVFCSDSKNLFALFYVRRFLIHPLLLLVLIPAFYFHKTN